MDPVEFSQYELNVPGRGQCIAWLLPARPLEGLGIDPLAPIPPIEKADGEEMGIPAGVQIVTKLLAERDHDQAKAILGAPLIDQKKEMISRLVIGTCAIADFNLLNDAATATCSAAARANPSSSVISNHP